MEDILSHLLLPCRGFWRSKEKCMEMPRSLLSPCLASLDGWGLRFPRWGPWTPKGLGAFLALLPEPPGPPWPEAQQAHRPLRTYSALLSQRGKESYCRVLSRTALRSELHLEPPLCLLPRRESLGIARGGKDEKGAKFPFHAFPFYVRRTNAITYSLGDPIFFLLSRLFNLRLYFSFIGLPTASIGHCNNHFNHLFNS